ncbi:MAG: TlpA disulfide reductase family protein [Bryobacteraceae bacterium]
MKLIVFLLAGFSLAYAQSALSRRAPGFSLPDLRLRQHDLQVYKGKVVVIEFMQTTCPKCQDVTTKLEQVKARYGDKIAVFSVVTQPDNQVSVNRYIQSYKATSTFLFDCGQMTASYLQITPQNPSVHFPHILIIDKAGMIRRDIYEGAMETPEILAAIEPLLK